MTRVHTPIGVFETMTAAARALKCDRTTLTRRLRSHPDQYWQETAVVRELLPWGEYRYRSYEEKEEIYQTWCRQHQMDPDLASTAEAFFDAIDAVAVPEAPPVATKD